MVRKYAASLILLAIAVVCQAQMQPGTPAYDAWKLGQVQHPVQQHNTAAPSTPRGGGVEPCACWIEPDSTYTLALAPNDDGSSSAIALPFQFSLYGDLYSTCYVNNNGNVSFQTPYGTYSSSGFPTTNFSMLAPYWADVDTRTDTAGNPGGEVKYKLTGHALYVNLSAVGYYNTHVDRLNSFQLIISDGTDPAIPGGNNVSFCYGSMQWTTGDASQGVNGLGGTPATVGANKGDGINYLQLGRFDHDSTDWDGPFGNADGVAWLTDRHFSFSTVNDSIPPIFTSIGCDTLYVTVGSSSDFPMMMIAGGPGQTVTGTSSCPGIASYAEASNTSGDVAHILSTLSPTADEIGLHTIFYSAHNNAPTPLTSNYTVVVDVQPAESTGIQEKGDPHALSLQPNPAGDRVRLTWHSGQRPELVQLVAADGSIFLASTPVTGADALQLDLGRLAAGVYTVRASGPSGVSIARLMHVAEH